MSARAVGILVILTLAGGLVVHRCTDGARRSEARLDEGLTALRAGLDGDAGGFVRAREALAEAAGGVVFEPYPLFVLEVADVLSRPEEASISRVEEAARPVFRAWLERRFDDALAAAALLPGAEGGELLSRLARDLVRVGAARGK